MIRASGRRQVKPAAPMEELIKVWPWCFAVDVISDRYELSWRNADRDENWKATLGRVARIYVPGFLKAFEELSDREQGVIEMQYQEGLTLEDCGKKYGVTRDRIRQIRERAIRKMRNPARIKYWILPEPDVVAELRKQAEEAETKAKAYRHKLKKVYHALGISVPVEPPQEEDTEERRLEDIKVEDLDLSVRSYTCLSRAGIQTLADIAGMNHIQLCRIRNLGRKSVIEVERKCREYGVEITGGEV